MNEPSAESSVHENISWGGPWVEMVEPSALMGCTPFSGASTNATALATPSIAPIWATSRLIEGERFAELGGGAYDEVGLAGDLLGQVAEGRPESVGEDEAGDDEADAEHHREGGHRKPGLVGGQVAEGEAQHWNQALCRSIG